MPEPRRIRHLGIVEGLGEEEKELSFQRFSR